MKKTRILLVPNPAHDADAYPSFWKCRRARTVDAINPMDAMDDFDARGGMDVDF